MSHFEEKIDSKEVFRGKLISVRHDRVRLEDGRESLREVIDHNGAVVVLPYENGEAWFVRQFRYTMGQELLEAPAGKLEIGEDHRDAALRELKEETGLTCDTLVYMGEVYPSPGAYGEKFYMYFATGLHQGQDCPDEGEFLTAEKMKLSDYDALVAQGKAPDAKTIAIVAMARARGLIG